MGLCILRSSKLAPKLLTLTHCQSSRLFLAFVKAEKSQRKGSHSPFKQKKVHAKMKPGVKDSIDAHCVSAGNELYNIALQTLCRQHSLKESFIIS